LTLMFKCIFAWHAHHESHDCQITKTYQETSGMHLYEGHHIMPHVIYTN